MPPSWLLEKGKYYRYQPVNGDSVDSDINDDSKSETQILQGGGRGFGLFLASIGILVLSLIVLVIAATRVPTQLECAKLTSPYCK